MNAIATVLASLAQNADLGDSFNLNVERSADSHQFHAGITDSYCEIVPLGGRDMTSGPFDTAAEAITALEAMCAKHIANVEAKESNGRAIVDIGPRNCPDCGRGIEWCRC